MCCGLLHKGNSRSSFMTYHRALLTADPPIPPPKMSGLSMLAPPPASERAALAAKAAYRSLKTALPADELIARVRQCRSSLHVALRDRIHTLPPGRTGTPRRSRRGLWVSTPARPAMATYYSLSREQSRTLPLLSNGESQLPNRLYDACGGNRAAQLHRSPSFDWILGFG